jgi:hypothetical protein
MAVLDGQLLQPVRAEEAHEGLYMLESFSVHGCGCEKSPTVEWSSSAGLRAGLAAGSDYWL